MPTTIGAQIRTVADIIKTVTQCSSNEADAAENEICKSPANNPKLAAACGISAASIGYGGKLLLAAPASGGSTALPALVLGGLGVIGVKRFCNAMVEHAIPKK